MGCKCKSCKCKEMTNEQVIQQMEDQTKPFTEEKYSDNTVLRHFDPTAPDHPDNNCCFGRISYDAPERSMNQDHPRQMCHPPSPRCRLFP